MQIRILSKVTLSEKLEWKFKTSYSLETLIKIAGKKNIARERKREAYCSQELANPEELSKIEITIHKKLT